MILGFWGVCVRTLSRICLFVTPWRGCVCVCVCVRACTCMRAQSYLTLCNPMDCSPPGSFVHGIFQARILEWVAISYSRGFFRPNPGIEPLAFTSPMSPAFACGFFFFFTTAPPGKLQGLLRGQIYNQFLNMSDELSGALSISLCRSPSPAFWSFQASSFLYQKVRWASYFQIHPLDT